jgi:UDP-2,3-diacylglucosamine pyrophosphatase LpxH
MGVGRDPSGAWHPYEDFRWAADLAAFLKAVDAEGKGATDLVLNGDTFELLQSREKDCTYADASLSCTEAEMLARADRVLAAHREEIEALGDFAGSGSNRIVLVPGDHDAGLLFPSVARRVVSSLGAPEGRAAVAAAGFWLSADGQVYAEHGHQIGFSPNKFKVWPSPFVRRNGRMHLARPWGESLIQSFYNSQEERYPILDNLAEEGIGMKYGLAAEGLADAGEAAPELLRYFLFKMAWQQFRMDLDEGEVGPPTWDLARVRATGPVFLVESLPDDDLFKPLAKKALLDGRLGSSMAELGDQEIVAICDYRAAVRRARRRLERILTQLPGEGPPVTECPRTPETTGPSFEYYWRSRDAVFGRHVEGLEKRLEPIAVFVHAHTHLADRGFSPNRQADRPLVINAGAWQRTITPVQMEQLKQDRGVSDSVLLPSLYPEQLPPCYSFVQILTSTGPPTPALRFWRQAENGSWEISTQCTN